MQLAHFVHEGVEISVGLAHLLADLVETLNLGDDVGEGHLHVLEDGLVLVEGRLLLKDAHRVAGGQACVARRHLLESGHHLQKRRLAHAVGSDDADLRAGIERKRHVVEDHLIPMRLARFVHLVHEFRHANQNTFRFSQLKFTNNPPERVHVIVARNHANDHFLQTGVFIGALFLRTSTRRASLEPSSAAQASACGSWWSRCRDMSLSVVAGGRARRRGVRMS